MRSLIEILSDGSYHSGEEISRELGFSRAAVWKRVEALREEGWQIQSGGKRGYRLEAGDSLEPALWQASLRTRVIGQGENRFLSTVDSTNTEAKRMALAGAASGSLCLCEQQTAGRGRLGRSWNSPAAQGLWLSVLLRPALAPQQAPLLTFCAALAMREAVQSTTGLEVGIKWPNDLVSHGKKLCGILLEVAAEPEQMEYVIIGTGLNVYAGAYPPELAGQATAIAEWGTPPPRREVLTAYLERLEDYTDRVVEAGFSGIAEAYRGACITLGSRVQVSGAVTCEGVARDIDETGALLVQTENGLQRILSGDVSVRGVMGYV